MFSDDNGQTWKYGGRVLMGKGGYSPYLRYAFDGKDTIHFIATEDHPRNYNNSVFHGFIRDGELHFSDGKVLGAGQHLDDTPYASWDLTKVYPGDPDNVCWIDDVKLDDRGSPLHSVFRQERWQRHERQGWPGYPVPLRETGTEQPGKPAKLPTPEPGCTRVKTITPAWLRSIVTIRVWSTFRPMPTP